MYLDQVSGDSRAIAEIDLAINIASYIRLDPSIAADRRLQFPEEILKLAFTMT
jgi:hypothetical protein